MKKTLTLIALLTLVGCTSNPRYVEGTMTQIGAYIPYNGNMFGMEVLNYMNGCKVSCYSNQAFKVDRTYASTNEYFWGMVKTQEHTKTKVEVGEHGKQSD